MCSAVSTDATRLDHAVTDASAVLDEVTRPLLQHAVDEAARLLKADGAMVYLADRRIGRLRFGVSAGIENAEALELIRDLSLPIGTGLFGTAVERGQVALTIDYRHDRRFRHSPVADRIVSIAKMRSMVAAPLIADGAVLGALGAYSSRVDDFDEAEVALLRALADHAAGAISNARLIARLNASQEALRESEQRYRFLVENAPDLIWSVDAGGFFTYLSGAVEQLTGWTAAELGGRHFGTLVARESRRHVMRTWRALRETGDQQRIRFMQQRRDGSHGAVEIRATPIIEDGRPVGAHGAMRDMTELAELEDELRIHALELERRVGGQRALAQIAAQISSIRDPRTVYQRTVDEARRLLGGDAAIIDLVEPGTTRLVTSIGNLDGQQRIIGAASQVSIGEGVSGRAVARQEVVRTGDYLADDSFEHTPDADAFMREFGFRSEMSAPLVGEHGAIGAITVFARRRDAFHGSDAELIEALASQVTIAALNARLYDALRSRVEAQRTLAAIAAEMAALHDPSSVIQRSVAAAARLLGADRAQVNLVNERGDALDRPIAAAPAPPSDDDVVVPIGSGVAGMAARARRAVWTDDYLDDPSFPHDEGDARIRAQGVRSMMAAPLNGPDRLLGTITVQASRRAAFGADHAEILQLLADQAAIALTNARLYDELQESERRYRFLVDNSPDMVWSMDAGNRFTFVSGAVEQLTGRRPEEVIGLNTDALADEASIPIVRERYAAMLADPTVPQRMRIQMAHVDGRRIPVEILMLATVDEHGRFGGAHGAVRDISERAALEESLRQQSAVLAHQLESQRRLLQVNETVLTALDPATVLEMIADGLKDVVAYDNLAMYRVEDDLLRPVLARDRNAEAVLGFPIPRGSGLTWWSVEHREPVLVNDALEDERVVHIPNTPPDPEAIIIVPLIAGDDVIGAMNIGRVGGAEVAFTDIDFDLVQLFAGQAAVAITNARLYDQLRESEERYRFLVDNSPDLVWSVDAEGNITYISDSLEARTGWKPEEVIGQPYTRLMSADDPAANRAWRELLAHPEREHRLRISFPLPGGGSGPAEVAMTGTVVEGRFVGAHGSVRDITERERLEADLRRQAGELAAGQERAHLARELHDSVTQALFSMGLTTRSLELLLDQDRDAARQKLAELRDLQKDALAEMRTLLFELRPQSLEKDGLVQAIRTHAAAVQGRSGLSITVDAAQLERLPLAVEEAFYRITQEALHNVVKHAGASEAWIRLARPDGTVLLEVTDDGAGFDPERVSRGHLGLVGMRQRADLVGGELEIESAPGRGTTVRLAIRDVDSPSVE